MVLTLCTLRQDWYKMASKTVAVSSQNYASPSNLKDRGIRLKNQIVFFALCLFSIISIVTSLLLWSSRLEVPTKPARDKNAPVESSRSSPKPFSPVGSATSFNAEELRRIRSRFKLSENSVEGPSHLYVHVPINATTTSKQWQSWTKYLMIRNALEGFFNPKVRMVRATTPAESLERCRKDPAKGKGCPAITPIRHYSTCALVGNSGILLNSSCGNKIDSNDFVIRFNLGPL
ncbi:uncharacterized protein [Branchiostoma lanceolatum]|uniref:uncharacterized protein n=1 Tax=Branchiostoma lanceolatum TaxID=7740 RepID=UPI003453DD6B